MILGLLVSLVILDDHCNLLAGVCVGMHGLTYTCLYQTIAIGINVAVTIMKRGRENRVKRNRVCITAVATGALSLDFLKTMGISLPKGVNRGDFGQF